MFKKYTSSILTVITLLFLIFTTGYGQGDNSPDPNVNLGCLEEAVLTGSVTPEDSGRGIPSDILWNPATNSYLTESTYHEYGVAYQQVVGGITKDNPTYWQVTWPTAKNVNYITCKGPYSNQPQPHTGWAVQTYDAETESWRDLAKAHDGWDEDSLRGVGEWVENKTLEWRGLETVVTTGIRFCAYANPDSLADEVVTRADSLVSWVFVGGGPGDAFSPPSAMIQYLDYSAETATNTKNEMVNLALLDEAVVSSNLTPENHPNGRGQPADMLFNPAKLVLGTDPPVYGDFNETGTNWGEFGYDWDYHAGVVLYEEPFYWQVEFAVPKNINYFTWGGTYPNQPEPDAMWAVEYWDGAAWVELVSGIGTDRDAGEYLYDSNGLVYDFTGIGVDSLTNSTWLSEEPIQTKKFRLAVWDDTFDLWSFHIRGRGGRTDNWDETVWRRYYNPDSPEGTLGGADGIPSTFKAILLQYRDVSAMAIESEDLVKPTEFALDQNYPNPFNPQTNIQFTIQKSGHVRLDVYNIRGQKVAVVVNETMPSGIHQVTFNAESLSSGIYYYQLKTDQGIITKKMMLIK